MRKNMSEHLRLVESDALEGRREKEDPEVLMDHVQAMLRGWDQPVSLSLSQSLGFKGQNLDTADNFL
tara:strand:- start:256 stop:456 length:201 start_codon:yes stop_codon:yes gene_type:complete